MMIWNRLRYLWPAWRRHEEREMREELESLTAIAGAKELGNLTLAVEDARATWGWTWLGSIFADCRRFGFDRFVCQKTAQVFGQVLGGGVAIGGVFADGFFDNRFDLDEFREGLSRRLPAEISSARR